MYEELPRRSSVEWTTTQVRLGAGRHQNGCYVHWVNMTCNSDPESTGRSRSATGPGQIFIGDLGALDKIATREQYQSLVVLGGFDQNYTTQRHDTTSLQLIRLKPVVRSSTLLVVIFADQDE